jgi:outer membrane receptor protein involved in Fe transport
VEVFTRAQTDLGKIVLSESSTQLDEVSIVAQRPLVKVEIDKLTYNAKDDPEASTSNVLDLLRKVPMVTVDAEDNIQLKGSSNFKIYLNGKPSNMITNNPSQVLKSMPANSIKDIEVITDPGAKYDAEGVGGIINIITDKRVDDGYSGSVGANGDTYGGYGGNTYLALKYGKFGFTGNASYYHHSRPESESTYIREDFAPNPENVLTQDGTNKSKGGGLFFSGALSYEPDTLNLFNLSVSRFGGDFSSTGLQNALSKGAQNYSCLAHSFSKQKYGGVELSTDYQRNFKKKGEMLTLSYRFQQNPNDSEYENLFTDVTGNYFHPDGYRRSRKGINDAGGKEHTGQIDYVNPLTDKHSVETGLKYIFRQNSSWGDNTYFDVKDNTWKVDLSRKNDLDHDQHIVSGYAGYSFKTGKIGVKAGLRGEYTDQDIHFMSAKDTTIQTHFFDLVPSLTFSYQLGMTQTLRVGYNMRISRPGIWYLNPFINDVNPANISYGDPKLDAEQSHSFNINFGSFSQKVNLNASLNYSFTKNAIASYSFIEEGVTHNKYDNIGKNQHIGLNLYGSWTPSQKIRLYTNANVNYTDIRSNNGNQLKNNGFSGQGFGGLMLTFPQDFRVGANAGIFSGRVQLQTTQSAFYFYSFNVMKSFLNKKLDINLSATNPFTEFVEFSSTTKGKGFMQESTFMQPMRSLRLSVTYRFGDLKTSIKKVQRTISNDDVKAGESGSLPGTTGSTSTSRSESGN